MSCSCCKSIICLGEFDGRSSVLQKKLLDAVGKREGWFRESRHGRTPKLRFHLGGQRWRIHANCTCENIRFLAENLEDFDGWTVGSGGGKVLGLKHADVRSRAGWFIYLDEK
jgi:hypothetical protein